MDMDESPHVPIILGRPFFATAGAIINVQAGTIIFQFYGKRVDFCFLPPTPSLVPSACPFHVARTFSTPSVAISEVEESYRDGGPHMRLISPQAHDGVVAFQG